MPMHALHPDKLPVENWEGFPFRTLLPKEVGGLLGIYLLTVTRANSHTHDDLDQVYIVHSGRGRMRIGREEAEVGPGCLVHIPCGQEHSLTPLGDEPVIVYSLEYQVR